jgi:hypothetical protein
VLPAVREHKAEEGTKKLVAGKILGPVEVRLVGNPEGGDTLGKNTEAEVHPEPLEQKPQDRRSSLHTLLPHEPIRTVPSWQLLALGSCVADHLCSVPEEGAVHLRQDPRSFDFRYYCSL